MADFKKTLTFMGLGPMPQIFSPFFLMGCPYWVSSRSVGGTLPGSFAALKLAYYLIDTGLAKKCSLQTLTNPLPSGRTLVTKKRWKIWGMRLSANEKTAVTPKPPLGKHLSDSANPIQNLFLFVKPLT